MHTVWGPAPFNVGYIGAPLSTAISFNLIALATAVYIWLYDPRTAWHPLNRAQLMEGKQLRLLVKLGLALRSDSEHDKRENQEEANETDKSEDDARRDFVVQEACSAA